MKIWKCKECHSLYTSNFIEQEIQWCGNCGEVMTLQSEPRPEGKIDEFSTVEGLTFRAWAATAAMQGIINREWRGPGEVADQAVMFADALIDALNKPKEP